VRKNRVFLVLSVAVALLFRTARAQEEHQHSHGDTESLGKVNFSTSCSADAASDFTRAVAFLHSFGYEESRRSFKAVATKDPGCAMAYWGIAMTWYHPIWSPPTAADLAAGKTAVGKAMEIGGKTDRERGYIGAIKAFYRDSETVPHGPRAKAYETATAQLSQRFPDDHEAAIFYALALLGTAPPSDTTYVNQKKAAAILNGLLPLEPEHPGITHYMIHSFDYPALAAEALPAARTYAKIAPGSPHALHMPSHIFTRLGLWQESIASNIDSANAARRYVAKYHPGATAFDALHAMDYLEYAYLQVGDQEHARQVFEEAEAAKKFDSAQFQGGYALVAIPARWTLERRDWKAAAALELPDVPMPWDRFAYAPATTLFARAMGAARTGQLDRARADVAKLSQIQAGLAKSPIPGPYDWAANVESLRLAAAAWVAYAEGKKDGALQLARAAAELDEKTGKHPVTPGAILPPRELLADMLMESGKPAEALVEYEASLREAPGRFNSLAGGARAAELSKNPSKARALYAKLIQQCVPGSPRPELAEARRIVGPQKTS